jgi:hypothetical protein
VKTIFCYLDHLFSVLTRDNSTSCSINYLIKFRDVTLYNGIYFSFCYCAAFLIKEGAQKILSGFRSIIITYPIWKNISRNYCFVKKLELNQKWKIYFRKYSKIGHYKKIGRYNLFGYCKSKHSEHPELKFRLEFRIGNIFLENKKIFSRLKFYKIRSIYEKPANLNSAFAY